MDIPTELAEKLKRLPITPGVYQHRDGQGTVLYVGKAKNLRNRVRSYFGSQAPREGRLRIMIDKIQDVDIIVTDTEAEALILENNLIKELKPRYNINLRDDKTYPYIVIKREPFPRVFPTRRVIRDGSQYFGPYSDVQNMHRVLDAIRAVFPLRTCSLPLTEETIARGKYQTCLQFHIKKCLGPCVAAQSAASYDELVSQVIQVLNGKTKALQQDLQGQMAFAAKHHLFEEAALLRDRIQALEKYSAKQKMVDAEDVDRDLFAVAVDPNADLACGVIFLVREGKIIGRQQKMIRPLHDRSSEQLLQALLERYYAEAQFIPDEVWLSHPIEQPDVLESLLHEQKGRRVPLRVPARGEKAALLRMVVSNAALQLEELKLQYQKREEGRVPHAVVALQQDLGLSSLPRRMECFDISHLGGTGTVASCVVFIDGKPRKSAYRSFKIRTVTEGTPDDFASMQEAVFRRYKRMREEGAHLPDLIVIDGGKGQVSHAFAGLSAAGLASDIPMIGIAKRLEEVFRPGRSEPTLIPKASASLHLLQRIRNEAHRFAVTKQRQQRGKKDLSSALLSIDGVGPKTVTKLLTTFGSVKALQSVSEEALRATVGASTAQKICAYFDQPREAEDNQEKRKV